MMKNKSKGKWSSATSHSFINCASITNYFVDFSDILFGPKLAYIRFRCSRFSVPPFQHTGGYVETSFNLPPGKLKLEESQFQITPGGTLKLVSAYRGVR